MTATVNLNGGTFNVKGVAINATWNTMYKDGVYLSSPFINSIVNVNGGRYKTTGGTIVQKTANGADGGTATLNIAGGYFNEKSGTTFKDQIATYVADTSEINTLDPLLDGIYKYEVAPHYVAKVQTGSTTKYHTTAKAAFDYAKTVANPTITLLDNCTLTDANYTINPGATWTGTLDLNNFTLTPTVDATYGRAFTIGGSKTKFIVTDNSVGQGGQIYYKGNSSVTIIYFVMGANTEMELAGGTLYVENTNASKKAVGFVVDASTARFTQSGGTFTIKGAYGANGYYGGGTATFTGGTMNVDGGSHQAIGLFPQVSTSVLNVSGTFALNVTSSLADSYGVLVKNSGATGTISGGKFNFNQNTMVGAQLDGSLTITGGYFVEKSGTTYKTQIAGFVPDTCDLNTLDPLYESKYKYQVAIHYVAKVVESGDAETYFTLVTSALDFFKTKNNATLIMLDNAELSASPSRYTLIPTISNWRGTWDLNDKTVSCTYAPNQYAMFDLNKADAILTITDNSVAKRGRLEHVESSASGAVWGLNIENGEIILEAGTIYAKNPNADATGSKYGISVKNANSRFTMNGGRIECVGSTNTQGLNLSGGSTATVSRGKILSIAELNGTVGNYAYGIYISGTSTLTVNGADSIYAKAGKADNTRAYALNAGGGTVTIEGTPFIMAESPTKGARALQSAGSASVTVNGGVFEAKAGTTDSYALIAEGTSTMTVNGGKYKTNQTNITYKSANATLTINGGYYNESSGTAHKTQIATYKGDGKVVLNLDTDDAEYAAAYRYVVTADPVAKVKVGSEVTYYTSVADAITAANTKTNPTVTMLKNASTTQQTITAAMTLDLNGKTITSTQASSKKGVFSISASGQTVTITDSGTGGKIDHTASYAGYVYGVALAAGTLNVTGGTIYAKNTHTKDTTTYRAYGIYTAASTTLTISDGTIEAECPNNSYALGISAAGNLTMTGGEVTASATAVAYGIYANNTTTELSDVTVTTNTTGATSIAIYDRSGHMTVHSGTYTSTGTSSAYAIYAYKVATTIVEVEGGKFSGTTMELYKGTNSTVSISGGYYVHNTTVKDNCASNHHVLPASLTEGGITYNFKVAEAYTLTWNLDGGTVTTAGTGAAVDATGTPSIVWGVGDAITAPVVTKTGYTFAAWTPAVAATMPAANTTYNATWTINSFDVTFNMQGHGAAIAKQTIDYNGLVTEPATPTEANYVFGGWYKEAGCTNAWNFATDHVTAATTLYAKWLEAVASVQVGVGTPEYFATVADAISDANGKSNPTVTMLQDAPTEEVTITAAMTINLNGKTVSSTETTAAKAVFKISTTATATTVTIRDGASGGKIDHTAAVEGKLYGIYVTKGTLSMTGGTVYVKNNVATNNSNYRTYAIASGDANGIINISGGTVEAYSPKTVRPLGVCANGNLTITGGTIIADGLYYARGIYANGTTTSLSNVTVTASATHSTGASNYAVQVNAGTATIHSGTYSASSTGTGACYAVYESGGTVNINGGKFNGKSQDFKKASGTTSIIGGYFVHDTDIQTNCATNYHVLPASLTEGGITYNYKVAEAYNLTWATDGDELTGDYTSGYTEPGTTIVQPNTPTKTGYTFAAWTPAVAATMPSANTTYTAQWAVASVTTNDVTRPYATMTEAWTAVNSATAASTLTMLQDVSITGKMQYTNTQNCTLDLNGHTITSTTNVQSPLHIYASCTFSITDGSAGKSGKLSMTSTCSDKTVIFGACAEFGNLVLEAGTIEVISGSKTTCGVTVFTPNSFTMNGGTIHVVTTNSQEGRGLYFNGSVTINDGTIHVEAAGAGSAMKRESGGTITINGGKFNINGATANINHTDSKSGGVTIRGGWYNTNNRLNAFVTTPYHVFDLMGESPYRYEVAEGYTLTWELDGGAIATPGTPAGFVKPGTALTAPTVTKTGYTFAAWTPAVAATMPSANTIYTATWTPVVRLIFTGATDNQWSKSSNWEPACVPTEAHDIYIQKPCSVDIEHAVAKSIVIDQSSSHTGKLTVGANKGLEVVGTISRTTTGEDNLSTRTEDLILETSTTGNASLIFNNSNSNAATVDLYSKGYIDGSGTKNYQYIGVPVTEANAASNFYGSWMYSWGIKKNGAWGWVSVKNGASVYPWTGYCITQQEPTYYAIEGTLVPTTTKDITVPADENMVVGNSWTAPIDINALTTDDLEGLLANIYFFNTGVDKTGSGSEAEKRYAGGTYVTVPIHAAPYKDGDDHINSMQGFFVKNTDKSATGTLHLDYDKHVRGTTRGSIIGDALHAPKHAQAEEPVVLKIKVSGENYDDKLLLLEREDFSTGFDNGWDGDKWDGNESALYLYTKDSEGTENSVSAIPELEGTVIGFRAGEDNSYTMYFDYLNSDEAIYLYDIEANTYTRIETGGIYWFMTNDNEKHDRFIITRKSPQIATGGGNVQSDDVQSTKARKLILDQKIYILVNGMLYDATGKMVK